MARPISFGFAKPFGDLRHDNPTLLLDVIICHVSDVSFILIVRGEAKEPHDAYFHISYSYGSGAVAD